MDPTRKLLFLLDISRFTKDLDKILNHIEAVIKEGAILDKQYYCIADNEEYDIPILYAIMIESPVEVIALLKMHWWKDRNDFLIEHHCVECGHYDSYMIRGDINVYLNNKRFFHNDIYKISIFNLFKCLPDDSMNHSYFLRYAIK